MRRPIFIFRVRTKRASTHLFVAANSCFFSRIRTSLEKFHSFLSWFFVSAGAWFAFFHKRPPVVEWMHSTQRTLAMLRCDYSFCDNSHGVNQKFLIHKKWGAFLYANPFFAFAACIIAKPTRWIPKPRAIWTLRSSIFIFDYFVGQLFIRGIWIEVMGTNRSPIFLSPLSVPTSQFGFSIETWKFPQNSKTKRRNDVHELCAKRIRIDVIELKTLQKIIVMIFSLACPSQLPPPSFLNGNLILNLSVVPFGGFAIWNCALCSDK